LKLQASFAKEPYKTGDVLQKETCNFTCLGGDLLRLWSLRLRLVGSSKLQASFAKEPYETGDVLPKETCNFTGLGGDLLRLPSVEFKAATSRLLKITGLFCKRAL